MIKILFPPGGYGTYLARCLYSYTNLNDTNSSELFEFELSGSSHTFRGNTDAKTKIWQGHLTSPDWAINDNDSTIIVLPHPEHHLDYYNNQFVKNYNYTLVNYISGQYSIDEINCKLKTMWNYDSPFDTSVPLWILREFFSLCIIDCFNNGYSLEQYANIPNKLTITTQDIILNFENIFDTICQAVNLTNTATVESIRQNHKNFLLAQRYCNSQLNCNQWVKSIIEGNEMQSPCKTIFDEAYIQHSLRTQGYEVRCHNLTEFPTSALIMNFYQLYTQCEQLKL